jgi:hypothetical protein
MEWKRRLEDEADRLALKAANLRERDKRVMASQEQSVADDILAALAHIEQLTRERDEARATKDMHKERQQEEIALRLKAEAALAAERERSERLRSAARIVLRHPRFGTMVSLVLDELRDALRDTAPEGGDHASEEKA